MAERGSAGTACPQCGTRPPSDDAAFCNKCGTRLQDRCNACTRLNPAGSAYCSGCGVSLSGAGGSPGWGSTEPVGWERTEPRARPVPISMECPRCHAVNERGAQFCFSCGLPVDDEHPSGARLAAGAPAGFWVRVFALLIDAAVLFVIALIIEAALDRATSDLRFWIGMLVNAAYFTISVSVWSATVGKRLLGICVLRSDGSKVGPARAFGRWLAYIPSTLLLLFGYLMVAIFSDKRALHDHICDTVVVYRRH